MKLTDACRAAYEADARKAVHQASSLEDLAGYLYLRGPRAIEAALHELECNTTREEWARFCTDVEEGRPMKETELEAPAGDSPQTIVYTLSLRCGAFASPIAEQLAEQGLQVPAIHTAGWQRQADAVTLLVIHGVLTETEGKKARGRLFRRILEEVSWPLAEVDADGDSP